MTPSKTQLEKMDSYKAHLEQLIKIIEDFVDVRWRFLHTNVDTDFFGNTIDSQKEILNYNLTKINIAEKIDKCCFDYHQDNELTDREITFIKRAFEAGMDSAFECVDMGADGNWGESDLNHFITELKEELKHEN